MLQPSRQDVPEYADYLAEIGATVARVNAAHGREGYQPIDLRLADDMAMAVAAYTVCDVLMVNALADGMNLVAKEFDVQQQAEALHEALTMDRGLRRARREAAAAVVEENDIAKWLHAQLADLGVRPPGAA
jgi:trehalose 6-phosphate synthase